jgi:hypothetical protein
MQTTTLPMIGWKACEQSFYLDGVAIPTRVAHSHWKKGSATFLPFAAAKMQQMIESDKIVDLAAAIMRNLN